MRYILIEYEKEIRNIMFKKGCMKNVNINKIPVFKNNKKIGNMKIIKNKNFLIGEMQD